MQELAFIVAGLAVGLVVGLTGVGGGSLMTPLLIFGFGVHPQLAIGTDLLFAAFTKLGGSVSTRARAPHRLAGGAADGSRQHSRFAPHALGAAPGSARQALACSTR